jgi:hypothetical protein
MSTSPDFVPKSPGPAPQQESSPTPTSPNVSRSAVNSPESGLIASGQKSERVSRRRRPSIFYYVLTAVVAVIIVVAAIAIADDLHHARGTSTLLLINKGTQDLIPAGQFDSVVIDAKSASLVSGTVAIVYAVTVFTMSSAQFYYLTKNGNVSGYEWTSGAEQNVSSYELNIVIPEGISDLVFLNSYPVEALVGYSTDLTIAAT